ncbi:hypothetical protein ACJX0J_008890, partial [Zea mays]
MKSSLSLSDRRIQIILEIYYVLNLISSVVIEIHSYDAYMEQLFHVIDDKEGLLKKRGNRISHYLYSTLSLFLTKEVSLFWLSNNLRVLRASATFVGTVLSITLEKEAIDFKQNRKNGLPGVAHKNGFYYNLLNDIMEFYFFYYLLLVKQRRFNINAGWS